MSVREYSNAWIGRSAIARRSPTLTVWPASGMIIRCERKIVIRADVPTVLTPPQFPGGV